MKWARVINKRVIETINFSPAKRYVKEIEEQFVECTEETQQGHVFEGGVFFEYVETLLEVKQKRILQLLHELKELDKYLSRGLEDTLNLLITKKVIIHLDLPIHLKNRKENKESLRLELQGLQL